MTRRTIKKPVALLRPALERDYYRKNSVLAVSLTLKIDLYSSTVRVEPINYVYVFYKCYNRWTDSVCVADGHI